MGGKAPDPPDYGPLAQAQTEIAKKQMAFQRETFRFTKAQALKSGRITDKATRQMFEQFRKETERADTAWKDYADVYRWQQLEDFKQDAVRSDLAYEQSQKDREFAIAERDRQAQISKEDRSYYEDVARPLQEQLIREEQARAQTADYQRNNVVGTAIGEQTRLADTAAADRQRYEQDYLPYEKEFADKLRSFDTAGRRDEASGQAISDVSQSFEAERGAAERRLASYGIDPSMMRAGALDNATRIAEATASAQAGTGARRYIEEEGTRRGAAAVELGRGVQAMSNAGSAESARQGSVAGGTIYGNSGNADNLAGTAGGSGAGGAISGASALASGTQYSGLNPFAIGGQAQNAALAYGGSATGNSRGAVGSSQGYLGTAAGALATPVAYGTAASNAYMNAAETQNIGYQNELQAAQYNYATGPGALLQGIGSIAGMFSGKGGFGFAEGGSVDPELSPSGGAILDDVPARLTAGEFIVDEDTRNWYGEKFFHDLKEKAAKGRAGVLQGA